MIPLAKALAQRIRDTGPISVADFMAASVAHYYAARDPIGARGDFVTAPEVSQMFGELIGAWCADCWQRMGAPARFVLAELGPGRGTLLSDAFRALRILPEFRAAADLHLVETSAALRQMASQVLADLSPTWHDRVEDLPDGPLILIANEFLDALPVRQFVRGAEAWHERLVALTPDGAHFDFALDPAIAGDDLPAEAPVGAVCERSPEALSLARFVGARVARQGGIALFIDYGYSGGGFGDTLQALRAHRRNDVLADPGAADITAHVDFAAFDEAARQAGARVWGPVEQGMFLRRLGIDQRAERLIANAGERGAVLVASAYRRLVDPEAMGGLFKVIAIADPALPAPAGFAEAA